MSTSILSLIADYSRLTQDLVEFAGSRTEKEQQVLFGLVEREMENLKAIKELYCKRPDKFSCVCGE